MISTDNISLSFGGRKLFEDVNVRFTNGNCYGLIGANGAGKSTFVKLLSGELEPTTGVISIPGNIRLSVLKQDHFAFQEKSVLDTVLMGNKELYKIIKTKEELYAKPDFDEKDGELAGELEGKFAELNGWEAESEAGVLLEGLGIPTTSLDKKMRDLADSEKVKVLLAQALIGKPGVLLLDEPTNHLDIKAIQWLENFLLDFENTVIVVSHDRHFLNKVCTHIADIDFGKITTYTGNYDFWRQSSELAMHLRSAENKKAEDKAKELKTFIQRFSANASKSKQATSRQKQLEKLKIEDLPRSTRKYPFINFESKREAGREILTVEGLNKKIDGEDVLKNFCLHVDKGDKIVLLGDNDLAKTTLIQILSGYMEPDSGTITWGVTTTVSDFPKDNAEYFEGVELNLVDWLRQYSEDKDEQFIRGFLGRMLFSGEEALKSAKVLSGGEKVRCMFSRMMLAKPNVVLLDDPLSHLDLESITAVNEGLSRFNGTAIFTSHDHEFIQTIANRIIEMDTNVIHDKRTTYDDYLALN